MACLICRVIRCRLLAQAVVLKAGPDVASGRNAKHRKSFPLFASSRPTRQQRQRHDAGLGVVGRPAGDARGARLPRRASRHHRDTVRAIKDGVFAFEAKADMRW